MYEDYLAHYGIRGMKWGVRRFQPYSVRGRKSGASGKEVGVARKKSKVDPTKEEILKSTDPKELYKYKDMLTDKELQDRLNRLRNEQALAQMAYTTKNEGKKAAKQILFDSGKEVLKESAKEIAKSAIGPLAKKGAKWVAQKGIQKLIVSLVLTAILKSPMPKRAVND